MAVLTRDKCTSKPYVLVLLQIHVLSLHPSATGSSYELEIKMMGWSGSSGRQSSAATGRRTTNSSNMMVSNGLDEQEEDHDGTVLVKQRVCGGLKMMPAAVKRPEIIVRQHLVPPLAPAILVVSHCILQAVKGYQFVDEL